MITTELNKTIVITYDDATRMIDFCKDSNHVVSKDFYDWYLSENGKFFAKSGMLIVDGILGNSERCAISFDFSDPDNVIFCSYVYRDQSIISKWIFKRQDNLTMNHVTFTVDHLSITNMKKNNILVPHNINDHINDVGNLIAKGHTRPGFRNSSMKQLLEKTVVEGLKRINKINCEAFIYFTYALMYYVSKQEPEEITTIFNKEINTGTEKVKGIYKYSGYIDLRENKTYKPIIKKDPDEPVREYQRHIQKWTVRGHYRKTKSGLIWIDPHTKGDGELEKRIYGTEDEKDLNIIPQIFEVDKTVKVKKETETTIVKDEILFTPKVEIIQEKKKSMNLFTIFKSILFKLFRR